MPDAHYDQVNNRYILAKALRPRIRTLENNNCTCSIRFVFFSSSNPFGTKYTVCQNDDYDELGCLDPFYPALQPFSHHAAIADGLRWYNVDAHRSKLIPIYRSEKPSDSCDSSWQLPERLKDDPYKPKGLSHGYPGILYSTTCKICRIRGRTPFFQVETTLISRAITAYRHLPSACRR